MKINRICFQIHKDTNKDFEEQTVDKGFDMEDFITRLKRPLGCLLND